MSVDTAFARLRDANPGPEPAKYVVFEFHGCDAAG